MKNFFFLLIAIVFMASCNDEPQAQYDLGVKKVSDPFCGVFANLKTPFFVGSLDWPVFKQIGFKPDSINSTAYYFNVDFDEESVRQKAKANFCILDEKKKPLEGVDLYCNGKKTDDGHFSVTAAKGAKQRIDLRIDIPYEWSDTIVNGYIAVDESQIDEVNEIDLQESNIVGTFHAAQEICLSWGFWLIWLLMAIIVLCIVALFLWLLYSFLTMFVSRIVSFFSSLDIKVRINKNRNDIKKNIKEKKRKIKKKRKQNKLHGVFLSLNQELVIITAEDYLELKRWFSVLLHIVPIKFAYIISNVRKIASHTMTNVQNILFVE